MSTRSRDPNDTSDFFFPVSLPQRHLIEYIIIAFIYTAAYTCIRGIIPNEHLASGMDEHRLSLNRLRVQKGRCRASMKMWKLTLADVWGEADYVSSYDMWGCPHQFHSSRPRYPNTGRYQLSRVGVFNSSDRGLNEVKNVT